MLLACPPPRSWGPAPSRAAQPLVQGLCHRTLPHLPVLVLLTLNSELQCCIKILLRLTFHLIHGGSLIKTQGHLSVSFEAITRLHLTLSKHSCLFPLQTPPSLASSTVLPLPCREAEPQELPPRKAVSAQLLGWLSLTPQTGCNYWGCCILQACCWLHPDTFRRSWLKLGNKPCELFRL